MSVKLTGLTGALGLLCSWLGSLLPMQVACAADRPHIVLIMVDDMGYGDPACYNPQSKIRMPNIDGLAAQGMRFTDAHAAGPLCHMSRYGLLTGRYPFRTNVGRGPQHALIEPGQTTLASMLRHQGYHTAMVGKWHLGFEEQGYDQRLPGGPVDVGFESFFGIRASTDIPHYFYIRDAYAVNPPTRPIEANNTPGWSPIQGAFWRAGLIAEDMQLEEVLPRFTAEALAVIEGHRQRAEEQPLFLYLAYPAPHTPWLPSEEFAGKSQAGMYGDFAEMVDAQIGQILSALDAAQMSQQTLFIFTSDNGPTWYEQDVERFAHDSAGGLRGMKADAWEAGHRIPFIVRWPGRVAPRTVSSQLIGFTDVLATLASVTDYPRRAEEGPDGIDFSPALLDQQFAQPLRQTWAMHSGSGFRVCRVGPWKLIDGLGSGGFSEPKRVEPQAGQPAVQLYHLGDDPTESHNLAAEQREKVKELLAQMKAIEAEAH